MDGIAAATSFLGKHAFFRVGFCLGLGNGFCHCCLLVWTSQVSPGAVFLLLVLDALFADQTDLSLWSVSVWKHLPEMLSFQIQVVSVMSC